MRQRVNVGGDARKLPRLEAVAGGLLVRERGAFDFVERVAAVRGDGRGGEFGEVVEFPIAAILDGGQPLRGASGPEFSREGVTFRLERRHAGGNVNVLSVGTAERFGGDLGALDVAERVGVGVLHDSIGQGRHTVPAVLSRLLHPLRALSGFGVDAVDTVNQQHVRGGVRVQNVVSVQADGRFRRDFAEDRAQFGVRRGVGDGRRLGLVAGADVIEAQGVGKGGAGEEHGVVPLASGGDGDGGGDVRGVLGLRGHGVGFRVVVGLGVTVVSYGTRYAH